MLLDNDHDMDSKVSGHGTSQNGNQPQTGLSHAGGQPVAKFRPNRLPEPGEFFPWLKRLLSSEPHRLLTPHKTSNNSQSKRKIDVVSAESATRGTKWVTLKLAAELTGLSQKAIRRKIERNVWREGKHYRRADRRIFINMVAYEKWTETGN